MGLATKDKDASKRILFVTTDYSFFTPPINTALKKLNFKVKIFDYYKPNILSRILGLSANLGFYQSKKLHNIIKKIANQELINQVITFKPQHLLVIKGETITAQTIRKINNLGTITVNWFGDGLFYWQWMKKTAPSYSIFINCGLDSFKKLNSIGIKNYYLAYAGPEAKTVKRLKKKYAITFVGQHTPMREHYFKKIKDLDLKIWGYQKWQLSSLQDIARGPVPVNKAHQIIAQSKIVINLLTGSKKTQPDEVNIRTFETTAMGTFLLVQDTKLLHKYYKPGKEVATFTSPQELRKKAIYYLSHPAEREKIAKSGRLRSQKDHTFASRLTQLFRIVDKNHRGKSS